MESEDLLIRLITEDPINCIKIVIVFVVLIISWKLIDPIYDKVDYLLSRERKRDIALSRGREHVIDAKLVKYSHHYSRSGNHGGYDTHATYEYVIDGQTKVYKALFLRCGIPPEILKLYWIDNLNKPFAVDDYHYETIHRGIPRFIFTFLPMIIAGAVALILKVHI